MAIASALGIAERKGAESAAPQESGLGTTLRGISNALWYLDTPAAVVRSAIDYGLDGHWENPFDADTRVSSEQLTGDLTGLRDPSWARFGAATVLGVATDPLTYIAGPAKALTYGGKAAKAAGLLDDAAAVASRSLQSSLKGKTASQLTGRAARVMKRLGRENVDDFIEHSAMPLVGQRAAQQKVKLRDLVEQYASDPEKLKSVKGNVDAFLTKRGLRYDDIADQPLSGSFGFMGAVGNPLGDAAGGLTARAFDRVGEAVRWSPVGRFAHQATNKLVGGLYDPIGQATSTEIQLAGREGAAEGARQASGYAQLLQFAEIPDAVAQRTGFKDAKSVDVAEALDRYVEGVAATPRDIDLIENTPKLKQLAEEWLADKDSILAASKDAGLNAHQLKHKFGARYRPYQMTTALERTVLNKGTGGAYYDLVTGDMLARQKFSHMPGGIDQLRFYAKKKEFLGGRQNHPTTGKPWTDDEVADWIISDINNPNGEYYQTVAGSQAAQYPARIAAAKAQYAADKAAYDAARKTVAKADEATRKAAAAAQAAGQAAPPPVAVPQSVLDVIAKGKPEMTEPMYSRTNARNLGRFLNELDPADPVVFGNHPAEAMARYVTGRMQAIGTGEALGDAVISRAVKGAAGAAPGGGMVSLATALKTVGLKSQRTAGSTLPGGAAARARKAIAAKLGVPPDTVNLSEYSVPQSFLDSLTKAQNLLRSPRDQTAFHEWMRQSMRVFKAQVLAWPSRISRDWLSGHIGNALVVDDPTTLMNSMVNTQTILNGDYEKAAPYIMQMPLYANAPSPQKAVEMYMSDLAEAGLLKGMGSIEREVGDRTGKALLDVMPGSTPLLRPFSSTGSPISFKGVGEVLTNPQSLNPLGIKGVKWFNNGKVRKESTNPIFHKFEQAAEWSDAHVRLSGYNSMLQSGIAPREAAKRLKAIHVDYESLTDFERGIRDLAVPFYSYTMRSGQYAAGELLNPGGRYVNTLKVLDRLQTDDDEYLPQTYRERGGFNLSAAALRDAGLPDWLNPGIGPDGKDVVLGGVDIPGMSAVNMLAYKPSAFEGAEGAMDSFGASASATLQNVASQMSPLLRTVAETAMQRDMHTKQPLGQVPSQWDKVAQGVAGLAGVENTRDVRLPMTPITKPLIDIIAPGASRVAGFVGTALDPRLDRQTGAVNAVGNAFSPVRRYFVDEQQKRRDELAAIDAMIQRVPGARSFTRSSLPDEVVATLPPQFQALIARKKTLEREMRVEAKARKEPEKRAKRFKSTRSQRRRET